MAHDKKRYRTIKALLKVAKQKRHLAPVTSTLCGRIYCRFGRLYATDGYSLVMVEYPEFARFGDDEWLQLVKFEDLDTRMILETPEFEAVERSMPKEIFERHFIEPAKGIPEIKNGLKVDPQSLRTVLEIFQINELKPMMYTDEIRWELSAHNHYVSIKAIVMGVK